MEDETEEYLSNSLLYDKSIAERMAPAPDCVPPEERVPNPALAHSHSHGHGHGHAHGNGHAH